MGHAKRRKTHSSYACVHTHIFRTVHLTDLRTAQPHKAVLRTLTRRQSHTAHGRGQTARLTVTRAHTHCQLTCVRPCARPVCARAVCGGFPARAPPHMLFPRPERTVHRAGCRCRAAAPREPTQQSTPAYSSPPPPASAASASASPPSELSSSEPVLVLPRHLKLGGRRNLPNSAPAMVLPTARPTTLSSSLKAEVMTWKD